MSQKTYPPLKILTFSSMEEGPQVQNTFSVMKHVFHIFYHVISIHFSIASTFSNISYLPCRTQFFLLFDQPFSVLLSILLGIYSLIAQTMVWKA